MQIKKKKASPTVVDIIYAGGTAGMEPDKDGKLVPPKDATGFTAQVMAAISTDEVLASRIAPQFYVLSTEDSVNKRPSSWTTAAYKVAEPSPAKVKVVLHGTDTMQWSAAALQFAFTQGMTVPTFFTGAQLPIRERWGDAIGNILRAIRTGLAADEQNIADVGVVFGDLILSGVRCAKKTDDRFNAFDAQTEALRAGVITTNGPTFFRNVLRKRVAGPVDIQPHFAGGVFTIELGPLTDPEMIDVPIRNGVVKAVLLKSPGEGNVPEVFLPFIRRWVHVYKVPVVIASKFVAGKTGGAHYLSGSAPLDEGAVPAFDTQDSTCEVKLSALLARGMTTSESLVRALATNFVGEVTPPPKKWLKDFLVKRKAKARRSA